MESTLWRSAGWCSDEVNTEEGAAGKRFTYGRTLVISWRKKLKYGRSVEGISGSGTGGGDMMRVRLPEEGEVVSVVMSSSSSKVVKTEIGWMVLVGGIGGHERSARGRLSFVSGTTVLGGCFSMAGSIGGGFVSPVLLAAFLARGSADVVGDLRFDPGGCSTINKTL